ncbi:hypothetical protein L6V77_35770 [Myxococcota bacterium]|nr:hypothetical protein [Myxococcota bacterium]
MCDGVDNDCNGVTDDVGTGTCACLAGTTEACYSGPDGTLNVGLCRGGIHACGSLPTGTAWGACDGEVLPSAEACNGLDDDCDGLIDNAIAATGSPCTSASPGLCAPGHIECMGLELICLPNSLPVPEV